VAASADLGRLALDLGALLGDVAEHLRRLLALLGDQQRALRGAHPAALLAALRQQERVLGGILALDVRRRVVVQHLAGGLGLDPAEVTLSALQRALPAAGLGELRQALHGLLAQIQRANERNAVLASRGLGHVDRLVAQLAAALVPDGAPAYGAGGRTAAGAGSLGLVDHRA
jgi:hypothetical protein